MKHTKGKWFAKDDPMFDRKVVTAASRQGMIDICTIPTGFDGYVEGEQHANAKLIAAAPELLEALEELLLDKHYHTASPDDVDTCAVCGEDFRSKRHLRSGETTYSAREKAEAAIAKAKS